MKSFIYFTEYRIKYCYQKYAVENYKQKLRVVYIDSYFVLYYAARAFS